MQNIQVNYRPYEAIRSQLLTIPEFESWIKYMGTDLEDLYNELNTTAKGKLKRRLRKTKHEYERRFTINSMHIQNKFRHTYSKVMIFIEEEIDKIERSENLLLIKSNQKSLPSIELNEKETASIKGKKNVAEITHYETLIALHYLVYRANSNVKLNMTKIVEFLYFLRREKIKVKISDTSEYKQIKSLFQNDKSKRKSLFKTHGKNASAFLKSIGILEVATLIEREIKD